MDTQTLASLLKHAHTLSDAKRLHAYIGEDALLNVYIGNLFLRAYGQCGAISEALSVLEQMPCRDVVSWNTIINALVRHHQGDKAFQLFSRMRQEDSLPNAVTCLCILGAFSEHAGLENGRAVHVVIVECGFESENKVGNALVSMYSKCKSMEDAQMMFDRMQNHDIVSWNTLIASFVEDGNGIKAFDIFSQMQERDVQPDKVTLINILAACSTSDMLSEGRSIHGYVAASEYKFNISILNSLLNIYGKCGALDDAHKLFESMHERNVVTWTTMIATCAQHGQDITALQLFNEMRDLGELPNEVTLVSTLGACASILALSEGMSIHSHIISVGFKVDVFLGSALVNLYSKCGAVKEAQLMFDNMEERNVVTWNSIVAAYSLEGSLWEALLLFQEMQRTGVYPNEITYVSILSTCAMSAALEDGQMIHACICTDGLESNAAVSSALVHMYGSSCKLEDSQIVFQSMDQQSVFAWGAIIGAYAMLGKSEKVFELFQKMQEQAVEPDRVIFLHLLSAWTLPDALENGRAIHACIVYTGHETDVTIANTLINMYNKCGALSDACNVFEKLDQPTVVSWNAMLSAYAQHGYGKEALKLFDKMQHEGVHPNEVTFLVLLNVCVHTGLVEKGHSLFLSLTEKHGIMPTLEHYSCMIDLLGRAGQLEDAEKLISRMMPEPDLQVWTTMLNACKVHGDVKRARSVADRLFELDPAHVPGYVTLSNMCATPDGAIKDSEELVEFTMHV